MGATNHTNGPESGWEKIEPQYGVIRAAPTIARSLLGLEWLTELFTRSASMTDRVAGLAALLQQGWKESGYQPNYNYIDLRTLADWLERHGVAVIQYTPHPQNPDGVCGPTGGNTTPLSDIAAMAVDLGAPDLSSTFRKGRGAAQGIGEGPSEKAKLAGIEAAEKAANTPGWGLDGIPKAMIDAMCVAAIRAAYATDRPNWGGLPAELGEPSAKAIEAASDVLRMPAKSYWAVGEDMIRPPRPDVGRALRAAYAVDRGRAVEGGSPDPEAIREAMELEFKRIGINHHIEILHRVACAVHDALKRVAASQGAP